MKDKKIIDDSRLHGIDQNRMQQDAQKMTRREFMRAAAYAGIAAPLATFIFNDAAAQTPKNGGLLKLGVDGGATSDSLDPALCTNNTCAVILRQWSDTLTRVTPDGGITGWLAESFEPANADGSAWMFNLHKDITFHNGKTLTAKDAVAMLRRHSDENSKSGALGILRSVKNVTADGKNSIIISLDGANADFPYLMADYHLVAQTSESKGDDAIGTGPYIMEEVEHGVRYLTRKNPNYFRSDVGHAEHIETLVINDATARITALTTGDVHMICRIDPKLVGQLKNVSGVEIENISGRGHYVFICHTNTAPFDNLDLRLALKYAIDRDEIVKRILHGYGGVGNDFPINAAYPLFPNDIPQRSYDIDKAKHHYKKSGHSGPVVLRVADAAFPGAVDAAVLYQSHAKAAGIDLVVQREPNDGYWSDVWNAKPFCASYWGGRPVQDQMYTVAYKSDADWNDTKWQRPAFDKLLLKARATLDEKKRRELYKEMGLLVRDDGGAIIPMFNDWIDATRGVSGYKAHANAKFSDDYAPVEVWLKDA